MVWVPNLPTLTPQNPLGTQPQGQTNTPKPPPLIPAPAHTAMFESRLARRVTSTRVLHTLRKNPTLRTLRTSR